VDLKTLRVESMECLIRWHSERLMSYGIQNSVHLLEQSGLSGLLDRSVLDSALALRGRLQDVYRGPISINLTAKSLSDEAYFDYIGQQQNELLLDLELELTETNVLHDVATAQQVANRFRELGARLVLDDFGTGFSSIEYLSQFQFHAIKIDRSFLRDGLNNQRRLLQSMVSIAHGVGSRVVAEGIETDWQLNLARCLEVDYGQGYLFSKPLCEADLRAFLVSYRAGS
jgi:EAL domain-containing protein (putative c-di-GMP-specific phosphodiesterase class I)